MLASSLDDDNEDGGNKPEKSLVELILLAETRGYKQAETVRVLHLLWRICANTGPHELPWCAHCRKRTKSLRSPKFPAA